MIYTVYNKKKLSWHILYILYIHFWISLFITERNASFICCCPYSTDIIFWLFACSSLLNSNSCWRSSLSDLAFSCRNSTNGSVLLLVRFALSLLSSRQSFGFFGFFVCANLDRRFVPYHGKCKRIQSRIKSKSESKIHQPRSSCTQAKKKSKSETRETELETNWKRQILLEDESDS